MKPTALVLIHDVMPATLPDVQRCLALLRQYGIDRAALLVVPGAGWDEAGVATLRAPAGAGHELVAHGWFHHTEPSRPYHRLHAAVLSRNVAEHLALDGEGIIALTHRSRDWFEAQALPVPEAYIPPAWALGRLRGRALGRQPFAVLETLRGLHLRTRDGDYRFAPLPLLGFEADTALREEMLGHWNRLQLRRARREGRPLRIAVHPRDPDLRLGHQLRAVLGLGWTPLSYAALAPAEEAGHLCA
jgi:predicted deacetylase